MVGAAIPRDARSSNESHCVLSGPFPAQQATQCILSRALSTFTSTNNEKAVDVCRPNLRVKDKDLSTARSSSINSNNKIGKKTDLPQHPRLTTQAKCSLAHSAESNYIKMKAETYGSITHRPTFDAGYAGYHPWSFLCCKTSDGVDSVPKQHPIDKETEAITHVLCTMLSLLSVCLQPPCRVPNAGVQIVNQQCHQNDDNLTNHGGQKNSASVCESAQQPMLK